jgi:phage baseplate assembly protein V
VNEILVRLWTRVRMMLSSGRVAIVDDSGVVQKMQGVLSLAEVIDQLQRAAEFGFTSNPPVGSDMLVAFIGGERTKGIVLGTNHPGSRPTGLQPGEAMLYSLAGQRVYLSAGGIVIDAAGTPVTVKNATDVTVSASGSVSVTAAGALKLKAASITLDAPTVTATGNLVANGNITDQGAGTPKTMAGMRTAFNTHTHTAPGGGGATTGPSGSM